MELGFQKERKTNLGIDRRKEKFCETGRREKKKKKRGLDTN